jgi:hypothetical protein
MTSVMVRAVLVADLAMLKQEQASREQWLV